MSNLSNLQRIAFSLILLVCAGVMLSCSDKVTKEEDIIPTMIIVKPDNLEFNAPYGGPSPQIFFVSVTSSTTQEINFTFENKKGWIDLQNPFFTGITPDSFFAVFRVTVPELVEAGVHYDTISILSDESINPIEEFEVKLTIGTEFSTDKDDLSFLSSYQGSNPANQYFIISSTAGNELNYVASISSSWLNLSQMSGLTSETDSLAVMIDITSLEPDVYNDTIWFSSDSALNSPFPLPVQLTVSSWVSQTSPVLEDISDIYFIDPLNGWAVGKSSDLGSFSGFILRTTDGGNKWNLSKFLSAPPMGDSSLGVIQFAGGVGWTAGANSTLLKTTDFGDSWQLVTLPLAPTNNNTIGIFSIYFVSAEVGWVVGGEGLILKTIDGGANWITQNSNVTQSLNSVYFTDALRGWAVGAINTVIFTDDGGDNWVIQTVPNSALVGINYDFKDVSFMDANNGVAVGKLGQLLTTSNGGMVWENESLSELVNLNSIQFVSPTTGWIVGKEGSVFKTTDGAQTWIELYSGTNNWLFALYFLNENIGWIGGENGVLRYTASGGI